MQRKSSPPIPIQSGSRSNRSQRSLAKVTFCRLISTRTHRVYRVTHAHAEGIAGAVAVAVATALAQEGQLNGKEFLEKVIELTPESEVRSLTAQALKYTDHTPIETAIHQLGVGWGVSAQDTVPYCLWCASKHLENFVDAMWYTVSGLGDRDTTCAIVGGIVVARVGMDGIPSSWRAAREDLQIWES